MNMTSPPRLTSVCVFCGASAGTNPAFADAARETGRRIAQAGLHLVYGGGGLGLMGELARAALTSGGRVTGIQPDFLKWVEPPAADAVIEIVPSMHARKARMAELADGFAVLAGGIGTFEETIEILSWATLGIHAKPVVLLNTAGYFAPFAAMLDAAIAQGFARPALRSHFEIVDSPDGVLPALEAGLGRQPRPVTAADLAKT